MSQKSYYELRIRHVCRYIENNLNKPMNTKSLAPIANLSVYQFHRSFKQHVNETVGRHIQRLRVERAASLLTYSDITFREIALSLGYSAPEACLRAFTKHFNLTPQSYRNEHRHENNHIHNLLSSIPFGYNQTSIAGTPINTESLFCLRYQGCYSQIPEFINNHEFTNEIKTLKKIYFYDCPRITPKEHLRTDIFVSPANDNPPCDFEKVRLESLPTPLHIQTLGEAH